MTRNEFITLTASRLAGSFTMNGRTFSEMAIHEAIKLADKLEAAGVAPWKENVNQIMKGKAVNIEKALWPSCAS